MPPSMKTAGLLLSPDPILTTFRGRPSELWPTTVTCTNQGSVLGHNSQSQLSIGSQQPITVLSNNCFLCGILTVIFKP